MRALIFLLLRSSVFAAPACEEACTVAAAWDDQDERVPSHDAEMASVSLLQAHVSVLQAGIPTHTHTPTDGDVKENLLQVTALSTWQEAFEEDPALFDGCSKVFFDVGANRGTHIRKLFEPEKYPDSKYLAIFDEAFGTSRSGPFSETGICAFGFEANPRWASILKSVEAAYAAKGWRVKLFSAAVSDESGNITFWLNNNGANSDWSASTTQESSDAERVEVPAIDLSGFMHQVSTKALPGYKLMKMDIEGAEYTVLPKLLETELLCKSALDKLTIEWHPTYTVGKQERERTKKQVMSSNRCAGQTVTKVLELDDESYLEDGMPLP